MAANRAGPRRACRPSIAWASVGTALGLACAAPLPRPEEPGASDAYRAELARGTKGERARAAREGLERAELDAARREHTILAYRRFLSEFPSGPFTAEVKARLEGLRWAEAESAGTEAVLAGFLADEPSGPHAAEAWKRLADVRLKAALASGSEEKLRAWLAASPQAEGRERALASLDEAQFSAAREAADQGAALRQYLEERADGRHRAEAQALLVERDVEEAALLEDDGRLSALARQGARAAVARAAERLELSRAAARLDRDALARLAEGGGEVGGEARSLLAQLGGEDAGALEKAAAELYLPKPTADEQPAGVAERAAALRAWALALDGRRLGALLAQMRSPKAFLALEALRSAEGLLAGLPQREARARAAALAAELRPKAQAAAPLAELSVLEEAAGRPEEALAQARAAVGRERAPVAAWRAAELEAREGEPAVALLAAQALSAQAGVLAELHLDAARGSADRPPDAVALLELCAAFRAAQRAEQLLGAERIASEAGAAEARERARRLAGKIGARLDEAERAALDRGWTTCARRDEQAEAEVRAAVARRAAAARRLAGSAAASAALSRARRRDPAAEVQQALGQATSSPAPARAGAPPLR